MLDVQAPPAIYQQIKAPQYVELQLLPWRVSTVCRLLGTDTEQKFREIYACSGWAVGGCLIVLPKVMGSVTKADQKALREHELAHCKGWPADHPSY